MAANVLILLQLGLFLNQHWHTGFLHHFTLCLTATDVGICWSLLFNFRSINRHNSLCISRFLEIWYSIQRNNAVDSLSEAQQNLTWHQNCTKLDAMYWENVNFIVLNIAKGRHKVSVFCCSLWITFKNLLSHAHTNTIIIACASCVMALKRAEVYLYFK
jgi:hypothetical protein